MANRLKSGRRPDARGTMPRSWFGKVGRGIGWLGAGPASWAGTRRIRRSATLIQDLFRMVRRGPPPDTRFKTGEGGAFDLRATAYSYGMTVAEMERRLDGRRRQTARLAYATFAMAWLFFLGWLWTVAETPMHTARVASAVTFLPFCLLFFAVAFYHALVNYQIRTRRLANWWAYLTTDRGFWPC